MDEGLDFDLVVVNPCYPEMLADLAVGVLETGDIHGRDPEDGTVGLFITKAEDSLEGNLGLADASKALDGGPLAAILVYSWRNSCQKLL